jgi:hypothetical protein
LPHHKYYPSPTHIHLPLNHPHSTRVRLMQNRHHIIFLLRFPMNMLSRWLNGPASHQPIAKRNLYFLSLFHNVTSYTNSLLSCIHVTITNLCNTMCTLVTSDSILWSLECTPISSSSWHGVAVRKIWAPPNAPRQNLPRFPMQSWALLIAYS